MFFIKFFLLFTISLINSNFGMYSYSLIKYLAFLIIIGILIIGFTFAFNFKKILVEYKKIEKDYNWDFLIILSFFILLAVESASISIKFL